MAKLDRRPWGRVLWWLGLALGSVGALLTLVGSVLPWVEFSVFGVPLAAPGVLFTGAWSALASATSLRALRRVPLLAGACGLGALAVGVVGGREAPRQLTRQMLALRLRLAPTNARLEQVNLAPIEPFGPVGRAQDLVGPGPRWVVTGGLLTALGALGVGLGDRWRRSCPQCHVLWPEARLTELLHCTGCGLKRTDARQCPRCFYVLLASDKHCARCGCAP